MFFAPSGTQAGAWYALSVFMSRTARNGCSRIRKNSDSKRHVGNGSSEFLRIRLQWALSAYGAWERGMKATG